MDSQCFWICVRPWAYLLFYIDQSGYSLYSTRYFILCVILGYRAGKRYCYGATKRHEPQQDPTSPTPISNGSNKSWSFETTWFQNLFQHTNPPIFNTAMNYCCQCIFHIFREKSTALSVNNTRNISLMDHDIPRRQVSMCQHKFGGFSTHPGQQSFPQRDLTLPRHQMSNFSS